MPALPADIIRATRRARIVTREDAAIKTRFPAARDQATAPEPGFFESAANAATVLALKAVLTGSFRRRFTVAIDEVLWIDPTVAIPVYHLTDTELGFDGPVLVTRWRVDLNAERTELEVVG
ncbi:hypothetical protein J3454_14415 [Erythrobacter sp. NFXS35]|uniref:hypothetical protein n=1 Tax=Erythrobacter sp. NFXS35 TaxID=2818436 RepID=UPI0032DE8012